MGAFGELREAARARGLCQACQKRSAAAGLTLCERCRLRHLTSARTGIGYFGDRAFASGGFTFEDSRFGLPFEDRFHAGHGHGAEDDHGHEEEGHEGEAIAIDLASRRRVGRFDVGLRNLDNRFIQGVRAAFTAIDVGDDHVDTIGGHRRRQRVRRQPHAGAPRPRPAGALQLRPHLGNFEVGSPDLDTSYIRPGQHRAHVLSFTGYNLANTPYANHMSFIKDLAPEMGRASR